jgi:hypothetical protein
MAIAWEVRQERPGSAKHPTELNMQAHVLRGTKQQIADNLARMSGEVREAIIFVEEPAQAEARMSAGEDIFAEMRPYMVNVEDLDDTREAVYTRGDGE